MAGGNTGGNTGGGAGSAGGGGGAGGSAGGTGTGGNNTTGGNTNQTDLEKLFPANRHPCRNCEKLIDVTTRPARSWWCTQCTRLILCDSCSDTGLIIMHATITDPEQWDVQCNRCTARSQKTTTESTIRKLNGQISELDLSRILNNYPWAQQRPHIAGRDERLAYAYLKRPPLNSYKLTTDETTDQLLKHAKLQGLPDSNENTLAKQKARLHKFKHFRWKDMLHNQDSADAITAYLNTLDLEFSNLVKEGDTVAGNARLLVQERLFITKYIHIGLRIPGRLTCSALLQLFRMLACRIKMVTSMSHESEGLLFRSFYGEDFAQSCTFVSMGLTLSTKGQMLKDTGAQNINTITPNPAITGSNTTSGGGGASTPLGKLENLLQSKTTNVQHLASTFDQAFRTNSGAATSLLTKYNACRNCITAKKNAKTIFSHALAAKDGKINCRTECNLKCPNCGGIHWKHDCPLKRSNRDNNNRDKNNRDRDNKDNRDRDRHKRNSRPRDRSRGRN